MLTTRFAPDLDADMQLNCHACAKPIPAEDVNIKMAIAKCAACNAVFSFADKLGVGARETAIAQRPVVPEPKGVTVEDLGSELLITRSWFTPAVFFLVFFCVVWDGFLIFWYSMAFTQDDVPWIMILFPTLHLAVGVGLTYFVICCFLNRTRIQVSMGQLTVRHGPLPWPGNYTLNSADIDQLYCQSKFHRGKHGGRYTYQVQAILHDGTKQKLVSGLNDPDQAIFIEQRLEDHLRIDDRRVAGEMSY